MSAIAFYTLGDSGAACALNGSAPSGAAVPDRSQSYGALAAQLVGRGGTAYGVDGIQQANEIVSRAASNGTQFARIYFIGHGRRSGDFIFRGQRVNEQFFRVSGQWTSTDNAARSRFAQALQQAAAATAEVWLYYCWSAGAFAQALINAGFTANQIHSTTSETVVHTDCRVNRQHQVVPVPRVSPLHSHGATAD
jgi:hypothetical protein